jgi:hypothetical protein
LEYRPLLETLWDPSEANAATQTQPTLGSRLPEFSHGYSGRATDHVVISGLRWLLVKPIFVTLVCANAALRAKTLDLLRRLIRFAATCGARCWCTVRRASSSPGSGQSVLDATERLSATLTWHRTRAAKRVCYCLGAVAAGDPGYQYRGWAAALVDAIDSPALRLTMLDTSALHRSRIEPCTKFWPVPGQRPYCP